MSLVVIWALPIIGATLIVTCSVLFRRIRDVAERRSYWMGELLSCPMCLGFWFGALASVGGWSLTTYWDHLPKLAAVFGDACAASWACWASHVLLCLAGQGRLLSTRPDLKHDTPTAYSHQTKDAHGTVIEAMMGSDEVIQTKALRHLSCMVHCDLSGEIHGAHSGHDVKGLMRAKSRDARAW